MPAANRVDESNAFLMRDWRHPVSLLPRSIDMILDLHWHLQRHGLWHQATQLVATRMDFWGGFPVTDRFGLSDGIETGAFNSGSKM